MSGSDISGYGEATTRSSPKRIAQIISKFGILKRKIVCDIGFEGMLKVPEINNLDSKFTIRLLNQIDIKKRAFKVNDETFIDISAQVVHRYLHIPMGPKLLYGLEDRSESEKMDFIRFGIGSTSFDIDEKNSLKAAEEIVSADYPNGMTELQVDQFKVSFVCFTMGNFLVAKYSSNHGIKDFWGSLLNPSEIPLYNFCQAVVDEIIESARHVQREIKAKRTVKNISGCHLLLQAMCLDALNLGRESIHIIPIPRIEVFTYDKLQLMINDLSSTPNYYKAIHSANNSSQKFQAGNCNITILSPVTQGQMLPQIPIMPSSMNILSNPPSTQYLAAYTRGDTERRLNDKQINDLRLHNARMKLFINNFKTNFLADINHSVFNNPIVKNTFEKNVDYLMKKVLDQVLILSKSMHDHSEVRKTATFISPSLYTSSKASSDNIISGHESTIDSTSMKRLKTDILTAGKNLLSDLNKVAANSESAVHTGIQLKSYSESAYVTPDINQLKRNDIRTTSHFSPTGFEKRKFLNLIPGSGSTSIPSCKYLNQAEFKNTIGLLNESVHSPSTIGNDSDIGQIEELFEEPDGLDLNEMPLTDDVTYSPISKILVNKGRMAKNPWFYGAPKIHVDTEVVDTLFNWLGVTDSECLDSYWINHSNPKTLKIAGNDFKSVLARGYNFTNDLLDLAIRRFGQMDYCMYGDGVKLRWLHPFETDFARKVLNCEDFLSSRSIRLQLTGKLMEYDMSNCRMIAIPNICNHTWSSYFWDMKQHIVHIVDPTFEISKAAEIHDLHNPIVEKLQRAIQKSLAASYDGWEIDWSNWHKNYVQPFLPGKKSNESGMLTLLAMRQFNGARFELPQTEASLRWFAKELLYNMLGIQGNRGVLPDVFIQSIE